MEYQKTLNLLNEAKNSKFVSRKQNTVNDQSNANYDVENKVIDNSVLKFLIIVITMMLTFQ